MAKEARWFPEGSLAELPDIDANPSAHRILGWALQPGDAVAFHMLRCTAQRALLQRRRVFSVRFVGDVRGMRRAPGRPHRISLGSRSVCERRAVRRSLFPVVYTD